MNKKDKVLFITFVVIAVLAILLIVFSLFSKGIKKDDERTTLEQRVLTLSERCIEINYLGCDGEGRADYKYNADALRTIVMNLVQPEKEYNLDWLEVVRKIRQDVTVELSKTENLSNDDVIEVTINIPEEIIEMCMIDEVDNQFNIVVSGLPERIEMDPFEGFYLSSKEINGKLELDMFHTGDELKYFSPDYVFDYELDENAKLGDEIVLTLNEELAEELRNKGYVFTRLTNTYTLKENNFTPLKNADEIPYEFIEKLVEDAEADIREVYEIYEFKPYDYVQIEDISYSAAYFKCYREEDANVNKLSLVFKIDLVYENEIISVYMLCSSVDLYKDSYGEISILSVTNEKLNTHTMIDTNKIISVPGDKLENIMKLLEGYELVE